MMAARYWRVEFGSDYFMVAGSDEAEAIEECVRLHRRLKGRPLSRERCRAYDVTAAAERSSPYWRCPSCGCRVHEHVIGCAEALRDAS